MVKLQAWYLKAQVIGINPVQLGTRFQHHEGEIEVYWYFCLFILFTHFVLMVLNPLDIPLLRQSQLDCSL